MKAASVLRVNCKDVIKFYIDISGAAAVFTSLRSIFYVQKATFNGIKKAIFIGVYKRGLSYIKAACAVSRKRNSSLKSSLQLKK